MHHQSMQIHTIAKYIVYVYMSYVMYIVSTLYMCVSIVHNVYS